MWESQSLEDSQRVVEVRAAPPARARRQAPHAPCPRAQLVHMAAYGESSPMGHSIFPRPERLNEITPRDVRAFVDKCVPPCPVSGGAPA